MKGDIMTEKQRERKWDQLRANFILFNKWDEIKNLTPEQLSGLIKYWSKQYQLRQSVLLLEYIRLIKIEKDSEL